MPVRLLTDDLRIPFDFQIPPSLIEERLRPEIVFNPRWLVTCDVPILVLTDSDSGGYGTEGFHLGDMINILGDDPWSHIRFRITKAHRRNGTGADLNNFRLDEHDLRQWSQIWIFGIARTGIDPLSPSELRTIATFMNEGGGVFATGDHEDLGNPLAAEVPRVRSMRRWWWPNSGPNGEPAAPPADGPDRHETLVMGGTQTDALPQEIFPTLYSRTLRSTSIYTVVERYPHPLLCGPHGVIRHLPDHMHEGTCEVPSDLSQIWTFDGEDFVEYPTVNGHQQWPEVIARADNTQSATHFGVLAAYDGHRVGVGRVAVDATWHHWFNINTQPYINASNPAHPSYTPATVSKWNEIKAYFRNVGVWLAGPSWQACIRNGGLIRSLGDLSVMMATRNGDIAEQPTQYLWQIGAFVKDALGRGASQCQSLQFRIDLLIPIPWPFRIDPWLPPELDRFEPRPGIDFLTLENVMLGAGAHFARQKFGDMKEPQELMADNGKMVQEVFLEGARFGIERFRRDLEADCEGARAMLDGLG